MHRSAHANRKSLNQWVSSAKSPYWFTQGRSLVRRFNAMNAKDVLWCVLHITGHGTWLYVPITPLSFRRRWWQATTITRTVCKTRLFTTWVLYLDHRNSLRWFLHLFSHTAAALFTRLRWWLSLEADFTRFDCIHTKEMAIQVTQKLTGLRRDDM